MVIALTALHRLLETAMFDEFWVALNKTDVLKRINGFENAIRKCKVIDGKFVWDGAELIAWMRYRYLWSALGVVSKFKFYILR